MKRKVSQFFLNLSVRNRLLLSYIAVIFLPILLFSVCGKWFFEGQIIDRSLQRMERESQVVGKNVEMFLSEVDSYSKLMLVNESLQWLLTHPELSSSAEYMLSVSLLRQEGVYYSAIVNHSVQYVVYDMKLVPIMSAESLYLDHELLAQTVEARGQTNVYWFSTESPEGEMLLCSIRPVRDEKTGFMIGNLLTYTRESRLRQAYSNRSLVTDEPILLLDADNTVVSSSREEWVGEQFDAEFSGSTCLYEGTQYYVARVWLDDPGWQVLKLTPQSVILAELNSMPLLLVLIGCGCFALAVMVAAPLVRTIADPLMKLVRVTDAVKNGAFGERVQFKGSDEIALLGQRFNAMMDRVEELMQDIQQQEQNKKSLEIRLLQSQIKPHFLYNSLSTIISFIRLNDPEAAVEVAKNLATFYRGSLSRGSDVVTLGQEFRMTESYLHIQMMRYGDQRSCSVSLPEELAHLPVPKLTLQPLVENAIYHGIKESDHEGEIQVLAEREGNLCRVHVRDTGRGMTNEQLEQLRSGAPSSKDSTGGFGVHSIRMRMTLMYGDGFSFQVTSAIGEGTDVCLSFPFSQKGEGHESADQCSDSRR